jgi:hypothetical protein
MTVAVRGRVPFNKDGAFTKTEAVHIQERLQALERALAGGAPQFVSPGTPTFGSGPIIGGGGGGGGGGGTTPSVADHGLLTGLGDDDHPQYVEHGESVRPHQHGPFDVSGLEGRFRQHFEREFRPHSHTAGDILGLDGGESRAVKPHAHVMGDVADLRPDDWQFVLAQRIFGG